MSGILIEFYDYLYDMNSDDLIILVPSGIHDRVQLIQSIGSTMEFPSYMSYNWDSLEELLKTLDWIPSAIVTLVHTDLPMAGHAEDERIYITILNDVVADWRRDRSSDTHEFHVFFPATLEGQIKSLLKPL